MFKLDLQGITYISHSENAQNKIIVDESLVVTYKVNETRTLNVRISKENILDLCYDPKVKISDQPTEGIIIEGEPIIIGAKRSFEKNAPLAFKKILDNEPAFKKAFENTINRLLSNSRAENFQNITVKLLHHLTPSPDTIEVCRTKDYRDESYMYDLYILQENPR